MQDLFFKNIFFKIIFSILLGGADGGTRTRTILDRGILSPLRLPVPPRPRALFLYYIKIKKESKKIIFL